MLLPHPTLPLTQPAHPKAVGSRYYTPRISFLALGSPPRSSILWLLLGIHNNPWWAIRRSVRSGESSFKFQFKAREDF